MFKLVNRQKMLDGLAKWYVIWISGQNHQLKYKGKLSVLLSMANFGSEIVICSDDRKMVQHGCDNICLD